LKSAIE